MVGVILIIPLLCVDGIDTASTLDCDVDKLNITDVREPAAAAAAAADVASDAGVFAPFPQLCHLNLAQNKVQSRPSNLFYFSASFHLCFLIVIMFRVCTTCSVAS